MAKLPKAVVAQAARARELGKPATDSNDDVAVLEKPEQNVEDQPQAETKQETQAVQESGPSQTKNEPEQSQDQDSKESDPKYWEHRFKTLQGISNAEKQRAKEEQESLRKELEELRSELHATKKSQPASFNVITDEDREAFDGDTLALIERSVKQAYELAKKEAAEETEEKIRPLESKLKKSEEDMLERAKESFWGSLETLVPNFRDVNDDAEFHSWLAEHDEFSGIQRQAVLVQAQNDLDAKRVAAVFKAFLNGRSKPEVKSLDNKVTPDPATPTVSTVQNQDVITSTMIKRHYDRKLKDKNYKVSKECQELEAKIRKAYQTGNIMA